MLKQSFKRPDPIKILINIGACLDIPTGFYVQGLRGEWILLGGLGSITAVVGRGNRYKSTILHYMLLSALNRLYSTSESSASTYDTEINIHETALLRFIARFEYLRHLNLFSDGIWAITDKTIYYANKWYEDLKVFLKSKHEQAKSITVTTPFKDRDGSQLKIVIPTFSEVDSFTEFETDAIAKIQDENELGDSGGNTIHMRQGLDKTRFLMEVPSLFGSINHFLLMTAQVDDFIQVAAGPYAQVPAKKLQHMKQNDKVKGVTGKFFFLMNNCWHAVTSNLMLNQNTKATEYPKDSGDNVVGDVDLNIVTLQHLRGKAGPTGFSLDIIVSQHEGVLPTLTEFHYLKTHDRFGITGTLQNYSIDLLPDVKLSRTTVRSKIDNDPILCRAINITSELLQLHLFHRHYGELLCSPQVLRDDLIKLGYDWSVLLNTRGWWTVNDDLHPAPYLSTLDLLHMRAGSYTPYWMNADKSLKKKANKK